MQRAGMEGRATRATRAWPRLRRQQLAVQRQPHAVHQREAVAEQRHRGGIPGQVKALGVAAVQRAQV